jgi:regulator of nucleoside diphosphate kinase
MEYVDTGRKLEVCSVYPKEVDACQNQISIFASLATALLCCSCDTRTSLPTPFGSVNVRINQLIDQPESAGDFPH